MIGITQTWPGGGFTKNITPCARYASVDDAACTARGHKWQWPACDFYPAEFNDAGELVDLLEPTKRQPCQLR